MDKEINIDELTFYPMGKHSDAMAFDRYLAPLKRGEAMGMISEAGCPAVADPGATIVAMAQKAGMKVVPLVGPSSILLALMASGMNGQSFAFNGYLPIDEGRKGQSVEAFRSTRHKRKADTNVHRNALSQREIHYFDAQNPFAVHTNVYCGGRYLQQRKHKDHERCGMAQSRNSRPQPHSGNLCHWTLMPH